VLTAIGYFQPITRGELSQLFGKEISRDVIGQLRALNFIAAGPRSPQPGAPYTYVTTKQFLSHFGFDTLRDLPDMEQLEEAGLLSKQKLLAGAGGLSDSPDLINGEDDGQGDLETDEPPLAVSTEDL
jgi:segregation and condensation protein B